MKKSTLQEHNRIANDILYYIYTHLDTPISIEELAKKLATSPSHLQRIFKSITGRSIHQTILSIRLEKAANLLVVNRHSTITQIAKMCGYSSQSAFIEAFKNRFGMKPKEWRQKGYLDYSKKILGTKLSTKKKKRFEKLDFEIIQIAPIGGYYIRHTGYDQSIVALWRRLELFRLTNHIDKAQTIALYHDNPAIKPQDSCAYVGVIATSKRIKNANLPYFFISGGIYAKFLFEGNPQEEIPFIHWIYHEWLPKMGFETTPKPAFAIYHQNPYLTNKLSMSYHISVTF